MTEELNYDELKEAISAGDVLVDFWAPWCGPCKTLAPVIDRVSGSLAGRVRVVKVNVDTNPKATSDYGIRQIPTLMLFKAGRKLSILVNDRSFEGILKAVEANLQGI